MSKKKDFIVEKASFTTIENDIFFYQNNGEKLSLEAWGLYAFMLSLPDAWDYTINGLKSVVNAGRDKVSKTLKELENAGFLERQQSNENGRFGNMQYKIIRRLQTPLTEKPLTEIPLTENQIQLITKELKDLDKFKDKGEISFPQTFHYLTKELINKKYISALDFDVEKYNDLFSTLDSRYGYQNVLEVTRYALTYSLKNVERINNKLSYLSSAIMSELVKREKASSNEPAWLDAYMKELFHKDELTDEYF